jgi:hypothetical protein
VTVDPHRWASAATRARLAAGLLAALSILTGHGPATCRDTTPTAKSTLTVAGGASPHRAQTSAPATESLCHTSGHDDPVSCPRAGMAEATMATSTPAAASSPTSLGAVAVAAAPQARAPVPRLALVPHQLCQLRI